MHETEADEGDRQFEVKAGDRMPYFLVDGSSVYDQLRAPKFHLLTFSNGERLAKRSRVFQRAS